MLRQQKEECVATLKGELEKAIKVRNEIDALQKKLEANAPIEAPKPEVVKKPEVVEKPASFIRLVDLKPKESKVGYGTLEIGIEKEVLNKKCPETISAHASSRLLYDIPKGSRMFTAIGVGRMIRKKDHAIFDLIVKVDGKELHRAKISPGITAKIEVKLPFAAKNIELIADSKGPRWADDAYWCWPRFHKKTLNINDDRGW